jgi:hypothetical protein
VYNFPIWLRRFTYKRIEQRIEAQNEATQKQNQLLNPSKNIPQRPGSLQNSPTQSTYRVKGAKK